MKLKLAAILLLAVGGRATAQPVLPKPLKAGDTIYAVLPEPLEVGHNIYLLLRDKSRPYLPDAKRRLCVLRGQIRVAKGRKTPSAFFDAIEDSEREAPKENQDLSTLDMRGNHDFFQKEFCRRRCLSSP